MGTEQGRAEFEAWWDGLPHSMKSLLAYEIAKQAYELGRAALQSQSDAGWKEAFKAWNVCASIHREWAKGKDAVFTTRQADFVRNAENAFKKAGGADALQSQDAEDAVVLVVALEESRQTMRAILAQERLRAVAKRYLSRTIGIADRAIDHARRVEDKETK